MNKIEKKRAAHKNKILDATVSLIEEKGIADITIRDVCEKAGISIGSFYYYFDGKDELLFSFVMEDLFDLHLCSPKEDIRARLIELYMCMINNYMRLGLPFMKSFYSTGNVALSAYMKEEDGRFVPQSILERSEIEIEEAVAAGILKPDCDAHILAKDVCTIIKGSVFEWCLCDGNMDIEAVVTRIINNYMQPYLN